jgi:chromosome segregation ATPase
MEDSEPYCKHLRILRNCYSCFKEFEEQPEPRNYFSEIDDAFKAIADFALRIGKLEEYKRLQDDRNAEQSKISDRIYDYIHDFEKDIKNHGQSIAKLENSPFDKPPLYIHLSAKVDECVGEIGKLKSTRASADLVVHHYRTLTDRLEKIDQDINELTQRGNDLDFKLSIIPTTIDNMVKTNFDTLADRMKEIEVQQRHDMSRITHHNEWLLEHDKLKDKIETNHERTNILLIKMNNLDLAMSLAKDFDKNITDYAEDFKDFDELDEPKTTGLTFEEAITAFKAGKKIRFHDGMSESTIYVPKAAWGFGFDYNKICRDHWEIVK